MNVPVDLDSQVPQVWMIGVCADGERFAPKARYGFFLKLSEALKFARKLNQEHWEKEFPDETPWYGALFGDPVYEVIGMDNAKLLGE